MGYEIAIDIPGTPKGAKVQIAGLGELENGGSYEISDEDHESFRNAHGYDLDKANFHGIEVKASKSGKPKNKEGDES